MCRLTDLQGHTVDVPASCENISTEAVINIVSIWAQPLTYDAYICRRGNCIA